MRGSSLTRPRRGQALYLGHADPRHQCRDDPLDTRCLTASGGTRQAASGLLMLVVRGGGLGPRHSGSNASCLWLSQPWLADCQPHAAEAFAETPNGGLDLLDAAQQDGRAEVGAPSPSLSLGTTTPNGINKLGAYFGVYGTTFV